MALTKRTGLLGASGQRAQPATNVVSSGGRQLQPTRPPVYQLIPSAPAPSFPQLGTPLPRAGVSVSTPVPRASTAQQIIQQAVANRLSPGRNVLQPAAQRALMTALAVSGSPAAATFQPRDLRAMQPNNRYATVMEAALNPQQQSQLFDQQIQITKAQADPVAWLDEAYPGRMEQLGKQLAAMQSGFANPRVNPRLQHESQALAAFPQMTPQDLRTRSDEQLAALLDLSRQSQPTTSAAATADPVTGTAPTGEMTKGPAPWGTTEQGPARFYGQHPAAIGQLGWENGYPTRTSGARQVADAMGAVLERSPQGVTQGGRLAGDDDGGFVGSLIGLGGDFIGELGELMGGVKDAAVGTFEDFLRHPKVQPVLEALELMDAGRVMNTENYGEMFTHWARGEPITWMPGGPMNPLNATPAIPVLIIGEILEEADPNIRDQIIAVSEQGYSSPQHIARLQEAGIDPATAGPQFTGDRAVWEYLMSQSDGWPDAAKYPFRIIVDLFIDPLNYLPFAGQGGKVLKEFGRAMRTLDDVSDAGRLIGTGAEMTGAAVEIGAKLPDLPVEGLLKGGRKLGGAVGEFTGLFNPAQKTQRITGRELAAQTEDALVAGRESVEVRPTRVAFDAEAQGVTPTSGPELIDTPATVIDTPTTGGVVDTPTIVAREGGDVTVTPRTGTAVIDTPNRSPDEVNVDTPGGITVADIPGSAPVRYTVTPGSGVTNAYVGDMRITNGVSYIETWRWDGSAWQEVNVKGTGLTGLDRSVAAARADEIFSREIERVRGSLGTEARVPTAAVPSTSGGGPTLADVNRQIRELANNPPEGMTPRQIAAEDLRLRTLRNDMRAGRVPSDGSAPPSARTGAGTPPATPVEREAAAVANSVPGEPRNTGEAEVVRAASGSTGRKRIPTVKGYPQLNKASGRARRLAKEDAKGLKKAVNDILRPQKKGEHEFSPIYGGHRPLDKIVTDAIDSKDPAKLKAAEAFVKQVDESVETNLRTDPFYQTWGDKGGYPIYLQDDPRFTDDFFEAFRVFEPDADMKRLRTLANGLAKGVLDDIGLLQFQLNHLLPMIGKQYPEYLDDLTGLLGTIGRIESKDYRGESAQWLIREYLDTTNPEDAETILLKFLTGNTELPVLADGIHKPYAHSIPAAYHAESIKRLKGLRDQWTKTKQRAELRVEGGVGGVGGTGLDEVSDAAFREADQAAQFAGSARGAGRSLGQQIAAARQATKHRVPTPAEIEAAIGSIKDVELRNLLLKGNAKFTVELAEFGDRMLPAAWSPPGYKGFPIVGTPKTEWNVKEGLDFIREYKAMHPDFDYLKARNEIGELAMGLQPKRTKAEVEAMKKAARAAGLDDSAIKDGASNMERITATKLVRGFDGFMTALRSTRMYSPITGTPGRIGDIFGNAMAHAVAGKDPWSAVRQFPLTFTSTRAYRKVARDPNQLIKHYAETTSHMADTGMTYNPKTFRGSIKLSDETDAQLPWLNDKLKNTPRGVRAAAAVWSTPYLKDTMVAGELIGRKMAVDRVFLDTLRREGYPAFVEYLEKRFPGQSKQLLKAITESGREKGGRSWSGGFSYGDVKAAVDEDAARIWQGELNRAMAKGDAEAERLFFNNRNTNADEIARRTFTFHYWMTRATVLYGRTLLQNPGMLSGFVRMYQEAEQISEEQGLPDWLSGMFKFYQSSGGMYAAGNIVGVLAPTVVMDVYSQEGNKFQALQNLLSPVWGGALGAIGLTQNVPDTLGTRTVERFFIDMGNFLKGRGVDLEGIPVLGRVFNNDGLTLKVPTEELTKLIITKANQLLGEPFGEFTPFDRAANEYDQVYSIGQQIGIGLWGPDIQNWTPEQVAELTAAVEQAINGDGEETWLSETIRATYGQEGAIRAGASLITPGGTVTRQEFRDQQIELSQEYWQDFYAGKPTTKMGEAAAASRQLATSAQPVWVAMNNEYYNIGTKEEQQKYGLYNSILNGPEDLNPKAVIVTDNGDGTYTFFTMAELAEMDWEDRVKIVEAWAANTEGMVDAYQTVKQGRDAFKAQHPDYAQYSQYQKGVYAYEDKGGISQFRKEMADNPTFKAAEDAKRKELEKQGKSGAVLEAELDHWATTQEAYFAAMGQPWKKKDKPQGPAGATSAITLDRIRYGDQDKTETTGTGTKKDEQPKDPNIDDYWSPEKGVPRLIQDQQQYDYDNEKMERDFGPYWNADAGEWEDDYDSAKERDEAGIGNQTYVLPSVSETMRRYEDWAEDHPGGTPEQFFDEMLQTEGFGIKPKAPGTKTTQLPAGGTTYTPNRRDLSNGRPRQITSTGSSGFAAPSSGGSSSLTGSKAFPLSQGYGMTDFAATQIYPNGMYDYTSSYTTDGSHVGHMGLDIATPLGTPLYAPVSGTVVQAGGVDWEQDDRYGSQPGTGGLRIEMPNGDIVVMGHMQQITVNVGDRVTAGQPVGYSGTAGADPSDPGAGAHVHLEYREYAPGQTASGYLAVDPRTKLDV